MRQRYETLDAMRGLAALAVVLFHVDGSQVARGPYAFAPSGYLAVDLFFVLSGFVISHAYSPKFGLGFGAWEFIKARAIRLYPLYFAGLVLSVPLTAVAVIKSFGTWSDWSLAKLSISAGLGAIFLPTPEIAPNAGGYALYPYNVPFWSLFFELIASLCFLFLRRLSVRSLLLISAVSLSLLCAAILLKGDADLGSNWSTAAGGFARIAFSFSIGLILARLPVRRSKFAPLICFGLMPACLLFPAPFGLRPVYDTLCIAMVFPAAVYSGAGFEPRWKVGFAVLGALSYALYALHEPIERVIISALKLTHRNVTGPTLVLICLVCSLTVAGVAYHYWDVPARRWLTERTRYWPRRQSDKGASAKAA